MSRWDEFDDDDRQYVSVTTFLDIISKPFLYQWYAKMERAYVKHLIEEEKYELKDLLNYATSTSKEMPYGARLYTQETSDRGSNVHKAIDYTLKALKLPQLTKDEQHRYGKWVKWWDEQKFSLVGAERQVRSRKHGYAGTMDALLADGRVIDWKTGKGQYPEHKLQNYAYQWAEKENGDKITGGLLVYIPEDGDVQTIDVPEVTEELFKPVLAALDLWRWANNKTWSENEITH